MKKFAFPLAALFVCSFGFAGSAKADYAITLETEGGPSWAGTSGTITIKTRINGVWATVCELDAPQISHSINCVVPTFSGYAVEKIRMTTDSSNGFWLDRFALSDITQGGEYVRIKHFGIDNASGWCFSTDPNETPSQHCWNGWQSTWIWTV